MVEVGNILPQHVLQHDVTLDDGTSRLTIDVTLDDGASPLEIDVF